MSRLKLAARAVPSADAGLLVDQLTAESPYTIQLAPLSSMEHSRHVMNTIALVDYKMNASLHATRCLKKRPTYEAYLCGALWRMRQTSAAKTNYLQRRYMLIFPRLASTRPIQQTRHYITTFTGVTFRQTPTTTCGRCTIALVVGCVVQQLNTIFVRRSFAVLQSTQLP